MSDAIGKAFATVKDAGDEGSGAFELILSTPAEDRDGDELATKDWVTPLPDHITFDIDHGMSVATTVGSGIPSFDGQGRMVVKGTYASTELGQTTRTLVKEGHIRSASVAFLERRTKAAGGETSVQRELLNGAFVAVPSNTEAVVLSSKSLDNAQTKALVTKALAASYEERQSAIYEELCELFGDSWETWCYIIATFDDKVVYHVCSPIDSVKGDYQDGYAVNDDGTVDLAGSPERVSITQVITVVGTASVDPKNVEHGKSADPDAAATAAASGSADETALATPEDVKALTAARAATIARLYAI